MNAHWLRPPRGQGRQPLLKGAILDAKRAPREAPGDAARVEATLAIEGIHCAACTQLIDLRVGALAGVERVETGQATHRTWVRFNPHQVTLADVLGAIARAGYRAWPVSAAGAGAARVAASRMALWRLFVAGFSMMQVMMYAFPAYLAIEGEMSSDIDQLLKIASFVLTVPVIAFSAAPFLTGAWRDLRARRIGMDVPVTVGVLATFGASVWATFVTPGPVYYDSVSMFVFLLLGGRMLESMARARATAAIDALTRQRAVMAHALPHWPDAEHVVEVKADSLSRGDHVLVPMGATIPADGNVVRGQSHLDEAVLSGESRARAVAPGAAVQGGAINLSGPLVVCVSGSGAESALAAIVRMVEQAANAKPALLQVADRYAGVFLWSILALAGMAYVVWSNLDPARALSISVAILIVTCPCALSLAAPVALSAAVGRLAKSGVLIARGHALETLARVTHVAFDKTGTLTTGRMQLIATLPLGKLDVVSLLTFAGRMEQQAVHPVAQSLAMAAAPHMLSRIRAGEAMQDFDTWQEIPGQGVHARLGGHEWRLGSLAFAQALHGKALPPQVLAAARDHTVVALADASGWQGLFVLGDGVRSGARELVASLQEGGCAVAMLSGDRAEPAWRVAHELGVGQVHAGMTPAEKSEWVEARRGEGAVVCMVGDGINDAPVLARAHVSVAMGSGAPLAQAKADMVLVSGRPADLGAAIALARKTFSVIRQNIAWAAAYNLIAIPCAAAGWVSPWMAALGMSASSLIVVVNSLRLAATVQVRSDAAVTPPLLAPKVA